LCIVVSMASHTGWVEVEPLDFTPTAEMLMILGAANDDGNNLMLHPNEISVTIARFNLLAVMHECG
jgi:hypothetical protein